MIDVLLEMYCPGNQPETELCLERVSLFFVPVNLLYAHTFLVTPEFTSLLAGSWS